MEDEVKKYHNQKRTEEIQDIIERMPVSFGKWVTYIVLAIFILLLGFGWFIRYPDVIMGQINVTAAQAPVKLVSNANGKLLLNGTKSMIDVKENQIIAYVDNPANLESVLKLDTILKSFDPNSNDLQDFLLQLPNELSFGELNNKYALFVNCINEFNNYNVEKLFEKQSESLMLLLAEQNNGINSNLRKVEMSKLNISAISKFYRRDSILYSKKVISEAEFDKSEINYNNGKDAYQGALNALINAKQQAQQTQAKLNEINIQKVEKRKELKLAVISSYNDLIDNIKAWEIKYVFKAPFDGKVQFLKFWVDNQFVQSGESVFTVVPKMDKLFGQINVPTRGAGKVKMKQEVIVKLDDFPFYEYGSVKGFVKDLSLSASSIKTQEGELESYLITVEFPEGLRTNYGGDLDIKLDAKGTAEIVTNDRRLLQRIFDNLKYAIKK